MHTQSATILGANAYRFADGGTGASADLIERRRRRLGASSPLFYRTPFEPVRGVGAHLFDEDGADYLDVYNNVAAVGHAHPRVVAAVTAQAALLNTHTRYLSEAIVDYADELLATMPGELGRIMFTCTGSEANDLALRIARAATGGTGVIITETAYHGNTEMVTGISPALGDGVRLGENVWTVPAPRETQAGQPDVAFARAVADAIEQMSERDVRPAALIVDTIFSSDGIFAEPFGLLAPAVQVVRAAGGIFIADEVQPGFGRTGSAFWGFARHGAVPELVTMGKPMGNGYPIAAVVGRGDVLDAFAAQTPYFNTFAGSNVAIAAATAVLEIIIDEGLQLNASTVGTYFREQLAAVRRAHPIIDDVRGDGLFIGVELAGSDALEQAGAGARIVNALRQRRILTSVCGPHGNVLKLRPPLVFTRADVDRFIEAFDAVLTEDAATAAV